MTIPEERQLRAIDDIEGQSADMGRYGETFIDRNLRTGEPVDWYAAMVAYFDALLGPVGEQP